MFLFSKVYIGLLYLFSIKTSSAFFIVRKSVKKKTFLKEAQKEKKSATKDE